MGRVTDDFRQPGTLQDTTIGTSAEQLPSTAVNGCAIKALPGNTGVVYVGFTSGVTTTTGWPLSADGETMWMPWVGNLDQIWVIASIAAQGAAVMYAL